jgi:hypothetical protein
MEQPRSRRSGAFLWDCCPAVIASLTRATSNAPLAELEGFLWELKVQPLQQSETQQAVENQKRRYDEVEESRHDQDQNARNERHDRRDVGDRQKVHLKALRGSNRGNRFGPALSSLRWPNGKQGVTLDISTNQISGHANQFE